MEVESAHPSHEENSYLLTGRENGSTYRSINSNNSGNCPLPLSKIQIPFIIFSLIVLLFIDPPRFCCLNSGTSGYSFFSLIAYLLLFSLSVAGSIFLSTVDFSALNFPLKDSYTLSNRMKKLLFFCTKRWMITI